MNADILDPVAAFPYLGCTVAYNNSDWAALYQNLWMARRRWRMLGKMVTEAGSTVWERGMLYKAVVQSVLLYGSEIWVVMRAMLKVLVGFYHRLARKIMGITARHTTSGEWEWPLLVEALETAGIWPIKEYIQQRQATIAVQVDRRPIYEICTGHNGFRELEFLRSGGIRTWDGR